MPILGMGSLSYNIITVKLNPEEVMKKLVNLAEESFRASIAFVEEKSLAYEKA